MGPGKTRNGYNRDDPKLLHGIYINTLRSLQNPGVFEVAGKTSTDSRNVGFFSLGSMLSFPLNFQKKKTSETNLCQLKARLKTRVSRKWLPTGTAVRCMSCCVCRMSWWAATHHLSNTCLQQQACLQEAFGTSSEQHLRSRAKSHHCGP